MAIDETVQNDAKIIAPVSTAAPDACEILLPLIANSIGQPLSQISPETRVGLLTNAFIQIRLAKIDSRCRIKCSVENASIREIVTAWDHARKKKKKDEGFSSA